jgi:PDZ domain-containing protein
VSNDNGGHQENQTASPRGRAPSNLWDRFDRDIFPLIKLIIALLLPLFVVLVEVPTGYLLEGPGPSFDLQRDLAIVGAETYQSNGEFLLTSVSLEESRLLLHIQSFFDQDVELIKTRDFLGDDLDAGEREVVDEASTLLSQYTASVVGLEEAGKPVEVKGLGAMVLATFENYPAYGNLQPGEVIVSVNDTPVQGAEQVKEAISATPPGDYLKLGVKQLDSVALGEALDEESENAPRTSEVLTGDTKEVSIQVMWDSEMQKTAIGVAIQEYFDYSSQVGVEWDLESVKGPSAGLMMTLTLINALTPDDLNGGYKVAGTGEIFLDGEVGPIGGLPMKIKAAEAEGAEIFLYPKDNQEDLDGVSTYLELYAIGNLDEAMQVLDGVH